MDWPVERTAIAAQGRAEGVLSDVNFGEVLPFVAKPLVKDYLARYLGPILGSQFAGLPRTDPLVRDLNPIAFVAGRSYMDLSVYLNMPAVRYHLESLEAVDHVKGKAVIALVRTGRLRPVPIPLWARVRLHLAYVRMSLRSLGWLLRRRTPVKLLAAYARRTDRLRELARRPVEQESPATLLAEMEEWLEHEDDPTREGLRHLGVAMFLHTAIQRLCAGRVSFSLLADLGKGIPNNPTTVISLDLWALAQEARTLADLFEQTPADKLAPVLQTTETGRRWWNLFEGFLGRHGHRGEAELDLSTPRWAEDPTFLLQAVANYLRHPSSVPTPPEMLSQGIRRRKEAAAAIRSILPRPLQWIFSWLYERYVLWLPFREAAKYVWLIGFAHARRVYRELGRRLAVAGHLKTADDVFWLRLGELIRWAESGTVTWSQPQMESRAREWQTWTTLRPPSLVVGTRGIEQPDEARPATTSAATLLRGTPVSSGEAEGMARVITDPHQADLRPGEILVTRYTDPAWTPLFFTAGALITEIGGVLSHGAVIAREIGLPAIVGVEGATCRITTGRRVKVNAHHGTVELL
ncbi:MAG TPA: PEP-utilizing enzyme [Nitrospirales bacterium]|nr:PEP-utilizing enzyme [Nitrospirales bacterium]